MEEAKLSVEPKHNVRVQHIRGERGGIESSRRPLFQKAVQCKKPVVGSAFLQSKIGDLERGMLFCGTMFFARCST
jgi:hypothetical protein